MPEIIYISIESTSFKSSQLSISNPIVEEHFLGRLMKRISPTLSKSDLLGEMHDNDHHLLNLTVHGTQNVKNV